MYNFGVGSGKLRSHVAKDTEISIKIRLYLAIYLIWWTNRINYFTNYLPTCTVLVSEKRPIVIFAIFDEYDMEII